MFKNIVISSLRTPHNVVNHFLPQLLPGLLVPSRPIPYPNIVSSLKKWFKLLNYWIQFVLPIYLDVGPCTEASSTYQGPHPQRAPNFPPPATFSCQGLLIYGWDWYPPPDSVQGFWLAGSVCTGSVCAAVTAVSSYVQLPEDVPCFWPLGSFHLLFLSDDWALGGGDVI